MDFSSPKKLTNFFLLVATFKPFKRQNSVVKVRHSIGGPPGGGGPSHGTTGTMVNPALVTRRTRKSKSPHGTHFSASLSQTRTFTTQLARRSRQHDTHQHHTTRQHRSRQKTAYRRNRRVTAGPVRSGPVRSGPIRSGAVRFGCMNVTRIVTNT